MQIEMALSILPDSHINIISKLRAQMDDKERNEIIMHIKWINNLVSNVSRQRKRKEKKVKGKKHINQWKYDGYFRSKRKVSRFPDFDLFSFSLYFLFLFFF